MIVWEALDALSHEFELCGLDATTSVIALFDADADNDRVALVRAALARVGADAVEMRSVHAASNLDEPGLLRTIIDAVDVVIDGRGTDRTGAAVGTAGGRVLILGSGSSRPQDHPPHANLGRRVTSLASLIERSTRLLIGDDNGTALHITVGSGVVECDHGVIDASTARATYPSGWVKLTPAQHSVDGDLVLMPGDAIPSGRRLISSPVRLQIDDDRIVSIDGEASDADVVRSLLEQADDANGYAVASISCGMNPPFESLEPFDQRLLDLEISRLTAGIVGVSFGENLVADRPCRHTVTMALRFKSVELDDVPVLHRGVLQGDLAPDVYEVPR